MSEFSQGDSTLSPAIEHAHNYNQWILDRFSKGMGNRLLEIGTGLGNFHRYLNPSAYYVSVDVDDALIQRAKMNNPKGNYFVQDLTASSFKEFSREHRFDTVLCINVLEHIADDKKALENMMSAVEKDGQVHLFVPAFSFLYNHLDKEAGHFRRYTNRSFKNLFESIPEHQNFEIKTQYFNAVGGLGWWVNGMNSKNGLQSSSVNSQIVIFDKYIVPVSRILDPLFNWFFGQSLVISLRRIR